MRNNYGLIQRIAALVFLAIYLLPAFVNAASPMDKVVEFYISSVPNPPKIDLNYNEIRGLVETGDIIIENNRAFPQWYAIIGSLIPDCKYVHAGMVIKGHVLKAMAEKISRSGAVTMHGYYRGGPPRIVDGKVKKIFDWMPYPVDPKGIYVVTPEVTINTSLSKIVALNLKDYLVDPAIGFPTKHIQIIRPRISTPETINKVAGYLTYHVLKKTGYDMGFVANEKELAIVRNRKGELWFDMSAAPVPLYCTELVWRALREIGIDIPTTQVKRSIAGILGRIPKVPRSMIQKIDSAFITADILKKGGTVIYKNSEPPTVRQAVEGMVDLNFKAACKGIAEKFNQK
ncbi:MAG: hypothetical protein ACOYXC_03180 [Candidatus Rifleibacteriota bacterium]